MEQGKILRGTGSNKITNKYSIPYLLSNARSKWSHTADNFHFWARSVTGKRIKHPGVLACFISFIASTDTLPYNHSLAHFCQVDAVYASVT